MTMPWYIPSFLYRSITMFEDRGTHSDGAALFTRSCRSGRASPGVIALWNIGLYRSVFERGHNTAVIRQCPSQVLERAHHTPCGAHWWVCAVVPHLGSLASFPLAAMSAAQLDCPLGAIDRLTDLARRYSVVSVGSPLSNWAFRSPVRVGLSGRIPPHRQRPQKRRGLELRLSFPGQLVRVAVSRHWETHLRGLGLPAGGI